MKNPDAQAVPLRVVVKQKGCQDGCVKRIVCFKCSEKGHYANRCPTRRERTRSHDLGLYCLRCGGDRHLASWCEKEDDDQPQDQNSNSPALSQTSLIDSLAKTDDQDISTKWKWHQSPILMPVRVAKILKQEKHVFDNAVDAWGYLGRSKFYSWLMFVAFTWRLRDV